MLNSEFKAWRERWGRTQEEVAQKFGVTRTTVQNWESGASPITPAVEMGCRIWDARFKQEDPDLGPLTLVYTDGPMFVNPSRPRLAIMQQESYATNAGAIARVQQLWGREDFNSPFIIEKSGQPVWNAVELARVVDGSDTGAPTLRHNLRLIAKSVKATSSMFASNLTTRVAKEERQRLIENLSDEIDKLAPTALDSTLTRQRIEAIFAELRQLGKRPPDSLVSNVAQAFVAIERDEGGV